MKALKFTVATALLVLGSSHAAGTLSVTREVTIDSTPATVWKLVGNFNALDVWHPAVSKSELNGAGTKVGTRRMLTMADSKQTSIEQLTAYDAAKTSYSYTIVRGPVPVVNYQSTITLNATPDGKTLLKWTSTFDAPEGADSANATRAVEAIYDSGLAKLVNNFAKQ
jgi:mxaD protein